MPTTSRTLSCRGTGPRARPLVRAAARNALAALALLLTACRWGTRPANFGPALGPQGASVVVQLAGSRADRRGELFAVDSVGVIVRRPRLTRVAWSRLDALYVERMGGDYRMVRRESPPTDALRERLARVSRFPQGLSGPLLSRVLALMQQPALEDLQ
jgi:hypothetical protein